MVIIFLMPRQEFEDRNCQYKIRAPGAYNRARFMCRIIYCLKIYLFRHQLTIDNEKLNDIRCFLVFVIKIYIRYWYQCTSAIMAPLNDFNMLKDVWNAREIIPEIANAVLRKFLNHLWYLSETNIAMSFIDPRISLEMKRRMIENMESESVFGENADLNRLNLFLFTYFCFKSISFRHFVNKTKNIINK